MPLGPLGLRSGLEAGPTTAKNNPQKHGSEDPPLHFGKKMRPGKIRRAELLLFDTLDVAGFRSVDADSITFVDERGDVYDEAGFESGRLHDGAGGGFLEGRFGLDDFEIHGIGEIDADGLFFEEFDFD